MLVLSRQRDETIMIGDDIEITVVDIRGDKVRLGINAPRETQVHRKEVYDAIKRENQQASKLDPRDVSDVAKKGGRPKGTQPDSPPADRETGETGLPGRSTPHAKTIAAKDGVPAEPGTPSDPDRSNATDGSK